MQRLEPASAVDDPLAPYRDVDRRPDGRRCWVLANMVAGLDGSTAIEGRVGALSRPTDARLFRHLRSVADVVVVGAETVRREQYGPVRLPDELREERRAAGRTPVPPLAIVSRSLALDTSAAVFADADADAPTMVVTCDAADPHAVEALQGEVPMVLAGGLRVEPDALLDALADRGHRTVLCEGGPTLLGEFIALDLLDELCLTVEPLMGGDPLPVAITAQSEGPKRFELAHVLEDDGTLFLRYVRPQPERGPG